MNERLYDIALEAINELFFDKSVSQEMVKENLEALISEIQILIDSLGI